MNKTKLLNFEIQELDVGITLETLIGEGGAKGGSNGGGVSGGGSASQDPTGMGPDGMFSGVDLGSSGGGGDGASHWSDGLGSDWHDGSYAQGADWDGGTQSDYLKGIEIGLNVKKNIMDRNKNIGVAGAFARGVSKIAARDKDSLYNKMTSNSLVKEAIESNPYSHIGMMTAAYGAEYSQAATEKALGPAGKAIAEASAKAFQSMATSATSQSSPGATSGFGGGSLTHDAPPVALDLDGDGIELVSLEDSQHFYDFDDDGLANQTAWVSGDDGILALDARNDGHINQAGEIRFDGYAQQAINEADIQKHDFNGDGAVDIHDFDTDGNGVISDLEGLRYFDDNKDGVLDNADAQFRSFGVLSDFNDDGRVGETEFQTLSDMGIASIRLSSDQINRVQSGSAIVGVGTYTTNGGVEKALADVAFKFTSGEYGIKEGGDDDDALWADYDKASVMYGAAGNDTLNGSLEGDLLSGNSGADILRGSAGDDTYVFGRGFGHDTIIDQYHVTWVHYSESGWIGMDGSGRTFDRNFNDAAPSGKKDTQKVDWNYYSNSGWVGEDVHGNTFDKNNNPAAPAGEKGKKHVTWNCHASSNGHQSQWVGVDGTGQTFDVDGNPVAAQGRKNFKWTHSAWIGYYLTPAQPVTRTYDMAPVTREYGIMPQTDQFDAGHDTLTLGENIALGDLVFKSENRDLKIGIADQSQGPATPESFGTLLDVVSLTDFFNEKSRIETLRFSDGTTLDLTRLTEASDIKDGEIITANETVQRYFKGQGISLSDYDILSDRSADIAGDDGNNDLSASDGLAAFMRGGRGDDVVSGSQGDDMLSGDGGDDILRGSLGDDAYLFGRGFGHDTLIDEYAVTWNYYSESGWAGTDGFKTFDKQFNETSPSGKKDTRNMTWNHYSYSGWVGVDENGNSIDKNGKRVSPEGVINRAFLPGISSAIQNLFMMMGMFPANSYRAPETSEFKMAEKIQTFDAGNDTLILGDDIAFNDLAFKVENGDLKIGILDRHARPGHWDAKSFETLSDQVVLTDFFDEKSRIENLRFSDGATVDLKKLVDFMGVGQGETARPNDKMMDYMASKGIFVSGYATAFAADQAINEADNRLIGTAANDVIDGGQGDDLIFGRDGNDGLHGGAGDDALHGEDGGDWLFGNDGHDRLYGGDGHDRLFGDDGDDGFLGGAGDDVMEGGAGNDVFFGEAGDDSVHGDDGDDIMSGGDGDDWLFGEAGNDTLSGESGNDYLSGGAGDDTYRFGSGHGNDFIVNHGGGSSDDRVVFEDGINSENLWFRRDGRHLVVETLGTGDGVSIRNWYLGEAFQVDRFEASSGSFLMASDVQNLVEAMARFCADETGIVHSQISDLPDDLRPVIAANWKS